ncbi:hypothetical protein BQ8482_350061 [Mesorhizobium delmotii]|uniref:Uncharacterized protein n=1 Tax=Mesorhizobium delmotii TaxID=1631247 RepID=A0A2P9AQJ9_9HYPH|nr:hypothetical protein BQ8482_350061 [Mesorhizobium delmotii]
MRFAGLGFSGGFVVVRLTIGYPIARVRPAECRYHTKEFMA